MENVTAGAILDQMLEPVVRSLTLEVAEQIAELRADRATQERIDDLAAKCNDSTLTDAERREYEAYVEAIDLIGILQAKARDRVASLPRE